MINEDAEPVLRRVLNRVWQATKDRDVVFLYILGRQEGSAWSKAFKNNQEFISDYDITMDTSYCNGLDLKPPQLK